MNRSWITYWIVAMLCATGLMGAAQEEDVQYLSPAVVAASPAGLVYVGEATAEQVVAYAPETDKVVRTLPVTGAPAGITFASDLIAVTCGGAEGEVRLYSADGELKTTLKAGHTPMAPVLSPDGTALYVCNRFNNEVAVYDLSAGTVRAKIGVVREPVAAALSRNGKFLFVVNHLPIGDAAGDFVSTVISVINTEKLAVVKTLTMPNGSTGARGICIAPDGQHAYVTHILARYQLPTTQLERGWMNTNALTVVDVQKKEIVNTVLLDEVDLGAANPWGVACTADGKYLCVAHAGTHEISVIDQAELLAKLARVASGEQVTDASRTADDVPNDLAFLVGLRRRIPLTGIGPQGVAVIGHTAYAAEYFTDSLGVVDVRPDSREKPRSVRLGPEQPMTQVRKGEMYFRDARFCFQEWQSCSSCHPDVRTDGLNWDLLNDGMGNPKQTKSLLYSHVTPPAMMTGIRADAETAVRAGLRYIQFSVRPEEDAEAIDAYLRALRPVPSPALENGKMSVMATRGRRVFDTAKCAECHSGQYFTDLKLHDVGTSTGLDEGKPMDTPTLIEVWRTAPYLHTGSALTIMDVLTTGNPDDRHGETSGLSELQLKELAAYVESL